MQYAVSAYRRVEGVKVGGLICSNQAQGLIIPILNQKVVLKLAMA
jgi:hypothetical protein